ncbi:hypothetical protein [Dietzia cercidiphylli]|uniref:Secreted protein n=1 Tax=Dietzia cercidiphylli TaxID=498199 RepID=A0ABP4V7U8_9ACTN|nr:hypothetical protein [Dietzia cercidiphylli]MBB1048589.1 hypothetical protein [Dietzia cercidiphylli]
MSVHTRFRAVGLATLAAVTALSVVSASTGDGLVAQTEAAYTDSEFAKAGVAAKWPLAYTRVVGGSAYSSTTINGQGDNDPYSKSFEYEQGLTGNTAIGQPGDPQWKSYWRGPMLLDDGASMNNYGPLDPDKALNNQQGNVANNRWQSPYPVNFVRPGGFRCQFINSSFADSATSLNQCETAANSYAAASLNTRAFGFGIRINIGSPQTINAVDIKTSARCSVSTQTNGKLAEAGTPSGRIDIGVESINIDDRLAYSQDFHTLWQGNPGPHSLSDFMRVQWGGTQPTYFRHMPVITLRESQDPPHAFSEVGLYIESWTARNLNWSQQDYLAAKMYFVLSRSECGVKRVTDNALPAKSAVFPLNGMPGGNSRTAYNGSSYTPDYWGGGFTVTSQPASRRALDADPEAPITTSLPEATTVTSPLEDPTASEITTSAPPDPSASNPAEPAGTSIVTSTKRESTTTTNDTTTAQTTTTSASPTTAMPTDPGTLSASADTTTVGTVEVDGDDLDVVVKGDKVPTGTRTALTALDTWINEGIRPSGDWRTLTSSDPDSDGWRWATVNQKTGTVVYIR